MVRGEVAMFRWVVLVWGVVCVAQSSGASTCNNNERGFLLPDEGEEYAETLGITHHADGSIGLVFEFETLSASMGTASDYRFVPKGLGEVMRQPRRRSR